MSLDAGDGPMSGDGQVIDPDRFPPGWPKRSWLDHLRNVVTGPAALRPLFRVLRRFRPTHGFGDEVVVSGHSDIVGALDRDEDFTIAEIKGGRMATCSYRECSTKVPSPIRTRYSPDRPLDRYLHFGHGVQTCFGWLMNSVELPELLGAPLRLPNLRQARGAKGKLVYGGPFPDHLFVEFDQGAE